MEAVDEVLGDEIVMLDCGQVRESGLGLWDIRFRSGG